MIAAKYEEIYPPSVANFAYITDNTYTKEQIVELEIEILACLDFNITFPTSLRFLERFAKLAECTSEIFYMSRYLIELTLIEVTANKWNPAMLAASCLFLSYKILQIKFKSDVPFFPQQDQSFKDITKEISLIVPWAHEKKAYKAIFKKYSLDQFMQVAGTCRAASEGKDLPNMGR